jgi:hypothetical protein
MGFRGRAATHKSKITMIDAKPRLGGMKLAAIGLWTSGNANLGLADERSTLPDDFVLPTLWQQFGEGPFLFQLDNTPVHKARSIQKWFVDIVVEELDWSPQSPDLNPIEHL